MNARKTRLMLIMFFNAAAVMGPGVNLGWAQTANPLPADHPEITVHGRKFTPQ